MSDSKSKKTSHDYYVTFAEKHKDKVNEKIVCDVCKGKYSYFNKSHHQKTKKHQLCVLQNEISDYKDRLGIPQ